MKRKIDVVEKGEEREKKKQWEYFFFFLVPYILKTLAYRTDVWRGSTADPIRGEIETGRERLGKRTSTQKGGGGGGGGGCRPGKIIIKRNPRKMKQRILLKRIERWIDVENAILADQMMDERCCCCCTASFEVYSLAKKRVGGRREGRAQRDAGG